MDIIELRRRLAEGHVIPAHPLALTANRKLDEHRQRGLTQYYLDAGAGGLAVGVHTTQFAIRNPAIDLFEPVLSLAAETARLSDKDPILVGGICGQTRQAMQEASLLHDLGYHAGLISLAALPQASEEELLEHCRQVSGIIPLFGFYLQPAVGGRVLSYAFWRRFAEISAVVAIKIAPFNRYQTLDVIRAVADAGRSDIALYTGNDDNIVADLITPFEVGDRTLSIRGGLLGHWAFQTEQAVALLQRCHDVQRIDVSPEDLRDLLRVNVEVTAANAAVFDAANNFRGCIPGIHEILRRQGLLDGIWCLDEAETLSPGQLDEINRLFQAGVPPAPGVRFVR